MVSLTAPKYARSQHVGSTSRDPRTSQQTFRLPLESQAPLAAARRSDTVSESTPRTADEVILGKRPGKGARLAGRLPSAECLGGEIPAGFTKWHARRKR